MLSQVQLQHVINDDDAMVTVIADADYHFCNVL